MPIHPEKLEFPSNLKPSIDIIRKLMDTTIQNMRDKPVVNIRLVGVQQVDQLILVRGRFKEDFAYEKGFIAILKVEPQKDYQIMDIVITPGFEE